MRANQRHISCDAITHTQSGLSANLAAAVLRRAMNGDDEWQKVQMQRMLVPAFSTGLRANLGSARCSALAPEDSFFAVGNTRRLSSNLKRCSYNAAYERRFCEGWAVFLWKLCARFQIAAVFPA
jgi:hypothetical protein